MRYLFMFVIAALLLGGTGGRLAGVFDSTPSASAARPAVPGPAAKSNLSGKAYVRSDRSGQFVSDIEIEGKRFKAVIDTGASIVVLRYEDAAALGLFRKGENFNRAVSTANGNGAAMLVRLNNLRIGDLVVYDVEALVLRPGAVSTNLIGMSFLRRLSKFEVRSDVIVLER